MISSHVCGVCVQVDQWVTQGGTDPLPLEEEHCFAVEVTEEDIQNSVKFVPSLSAVVRTVQVDPFSGFLFSGHWGNSWSIILMPAQHNPFLLKLFKLIIDSILVAWKSCFVNILLTSCYIYCRLLRPLRIRPQWELSSQFTMPVL